jgi:hypothetical protein
LKEESNHEQAESTHRLGGDNEDDRGECEGRSEDDRARSSRFVGDAGPSAPPWAAVETVRSDDGGSESAISAPSPSTPPFLAANAIPTPVSPIADDNRFFGWRSVRHVYRELVMLRDTLRARVFPVKETHRSIPKGWLEPLPHYRERGREQELD